MQRFTIERCNLLFTEFWRKPQTNGFPEFILLLSILLQIDRSQLTAVYCNRRVCKDNTSKDPFSQCENLQNLQGLHIQVKSEYVGTIDNELSDDTNAERQAQQQD